MKIVKTILIVLFLLIIDWFVYIILGTLLMNYDDFYHESQGPYWSWESMDTDDRIVMIGLQLWNVINILVLVYLIYRFVIWLKVFLQKKKQ